MLKNSNLELRDVTSTSTKKLNRCRSFHFRYLELCRAKNLTPLTEIRSKNNATSVLDFFGDKLNVNDWLLIVEALYYDQVLQTLAIRMRKTFGMVLEHLDSEKKAKLFRQKSVLYTKYVFSGVVEAISNCIEFNKNLRVLNLEGLPLNDKYVESIAKALSINESIKELSFQRSNIGDKGCEAICCTMKYLANVEKLNLSECELTSKGAEYVADMIKIQKISRYTEGWQKSLRYRDVDPETIPGLRSIALSRNPQIGDEGIKPIVEVLKEDVWIKVIDMVNCGLTDRAANLILDCLEINNYIIDFNVSGNTGISKFLLRNIREQLGKEDEDQKLKEAQEELVPGPNGVLVKRKKVTIAALKEQLKTLEEQLSFERVLRKKAEQLNEKLNEQIMAYEHQLENNLNSNIPEGYVMVKNESLQSIIRERNDFQKLAAGVGSNDTTPRNNMALVKQTNHKGSEISNPSAPLNSPSTLKLPMSQAEQRKNLKVRKVKSEVKYIEPAAKDSTRSKNKESKSDHEFSNETDFQLTAIHFETNIGDTIASNNKEKKFNGKVRQNNYENLTKIELDDLSIPTTRSLSSDMHSSDSDTLRNEAECQPLKVFIRHAKPMPLTPMPKTNDHERESCRNHNFYKKSNVHYGDQVFKSPRSLFLGLCDD
ncbi:protein Cep78 homolog [Calliphora vicina]|uniref:protein Cep78 homolog n=1 Tax=Calliphora vicina TaxID=7373 RepID=UPI00325B1C29